MPIYQLGQWSPTLGNSTFVAESADVIGRVAIADHANLWFGVVARGDVNTISIGENSNIQDQSMLHVSKEFRLSIGRNVTIGHKVTAHGCTIDDHCLIGMGAIILDGAHIGENSLVAAGSLVPPGKSYPPRSFILGSPARVVRELTNKEALEYANHYQVYLEEKEHYLKNLRKISS